MFKYNEKFYQYIEQNEQDKKIIIPMLYFDSSIYGNGKSLRAIYA